MNKGTIFDPIATGLEFVHEGYVYEMYLRNERWSLIRREEDKPNIPPVKEIHTSEGWKGVTNASSGNSKFTMFYGIDDVYNHLCGDSND